LEHLAFWLAGAEAGKIALAMLIVFGAAKVLAELFEQFGQPGIVGEILAGVLIGPGVLGWIKPDDFLTTLAELGVMFLLFRVGLEVKSSDFMQVGKAAALAAVAGVIVPFFAGWAILAAHGESMIESIFVGSAMVATSVGITAQVLSSKGLLSHRASHAILAAAVIDDVLGLIILAVVSSMAQGTVNVLQLALTAALAIGFTMIVARWGTSAMGRVVPRLEARFRAGEVQFNLSLVLLFALSVLATHAGVAAIIGAFLAGMALSESVDRRVHELAQGVTELLAPFFLAGIGINLNLSVFGSLETVVLSLVVLLAAVLSKLVGCGAGALALGKADAFRVGVGMVPRGEVGMVVAQIGLGLGVVSQQIYGVVVFMAVATTLVAPPLLKIAYRGVEPSDKS
jgi:Kef-type K+ transport system membrane component KefB